jgi:hypothetical protein
MNNQLKSAIESIVEKLTAEGLIGMAETARVLGTFRSGKPTHPSTPTRWALDGIRLPDGRRLKLEHIRMGDRIMTSKPALVRFLAAQQDPSIVPETNLPRSPAQRRKEIEDAKATCEAMGFRT